MCRVAGDTAGDGSSQTKKDLKGSIEGCAFCSGDSKDLLIQSSYVIRSVMRKEKARGSEAAGPEGAG